MRPEPEHQIYIPKRNQNLRRNGVSPKPTWTKKKFQDPLKIPHPKFLMPKQKPVLQVTLPKKNQNPKRNGI